MPNRNKKNLTLVEKQQQFSLFVARFIEDLRKRNYYVTLGEAFRPEEMAQIYASTGKGIVNSNHRIRLAIDLNIFYEGGFLTTKEDLEIPGRLWKSYSNDLIECCWGGDFKRVDANHFSFLHNGIR
jgi:hypothetical protein